MMKAGVLKCALLSLFFATTSFARLQPGVVDRVTAVNAANYSIKGFCTAGNGDVTITFGSIVETTPCRDVLGAYTYTGDVTTEVSTNPIRQCVDQVPLTSMCSSYTDNEQAPPQVFLGISPSTLIDADNESSYAIGGLCAPTGASISIDVGPLPGAITGLCDSRNRYLVSGDLSALADGTGYPVTVTVDDGGSTGSVATTVDKSAGGLDPIPSIIGVTTSFVDADLDTWLEDGDTIDFAVQFSEVVTASPLVQLNVGMDSSDKFAGYVSGTGTDTLNFRMNIAINDEQCNAIFVLKNIDLNGGTIVDGTGQDAEFRSLPNTVLGEKVDAVLPSFEFGLDVLTNDASISQSPLIGGEDFRGEDNCTATIVEASIGETPGGEEVTLFTPIPADIFSYRIVSGVDGFSFILNSSTTYFVNVIAYDEAGNFSAARSTAAWALSPVFTIPNLILYLDASDSTSVLDDSGNTSDLGTFDGFVDEFLDTSSSPVVHNFTAFSATQEPSFSVVNESLVFDQTNDCMETPNHPEINTGTVDQRSFSSLFETGADVNTLQMIFEEGGSTRGINLYVYQDDIYCGFWNATNDGDGTQNFISVSAPITANTTYNVTSVFDYTNYTGPAGPNGTFECYINGVSMGSAASTSRLFGHSGDVSLGCSGDSTRLHIGVGGSGMNYGGEIMEFMMFNSPPDATDALDIYNFLQTKWSF